MALKKRITTLLLAFFILSGNIGYTQRPTPLELYTYKKGDPNGTGKWYMGRQIAHVMGFQGIDWLERSNREEEENTSTLINNMKIKFTDVIADIGAGSGHHVFKMALINKQGLVYAVDIQDEMLSAIKDRINENEIENIRPVKGNAKSVNLPSNSIDKVLLVDVYHEFEFPAEMLASIKKALKPTGKIYLVEYRGEDDWVPIKKVHKMTEAQCIREMEAAGLKLADNISNLPWQHCMIFIHK
jgi:ubiquinone/menaquinone biosynthesis C-methylase UbiE